MVARTLDLRADHNRVVAADIEVAQGQHARLAEHVPLQQVAGVQIDIGERGIDGVGIEDAPPAAKVGMLAQAAVGDDQHGLPSKKGQIVRPQATGRNLANPPEPARSRRRCR